MTLREKLKFVNDKVNNYNDSPTNIWPNERTIPNVPDEIINGDQKARLITLLSNEINMMSFCGDSEPAANVILFIELLYKLLK